MRESVWQSSTAHATQQIPPWPQDILHMWDRFSVSTAISLFSTSRFVELFLDQMLPSLLSLDVQPPQSLVQSVPATISSASISRAPQLIPDVSTPAPSTDKSQKSLKCRVPVTPSLWIHCHHKAKLLPPQPPLQPCSPRWSLQVFATLRKFVWVLLRPRARKG